MSIVSALPFTLTNGTTADATQVMADFNSIKTDVNANAAANGANNDITSLAGLTTPLSVAQGGTGSGAGVGLGIGFNLLTSGNIAGTPATLDMVLTTYTAYRGLKFVLSGFQPVSNSVALLMRFSTNGGSSYDATSYAGVQLTNSSIAPTGFTTGIILTGSMGNLAVGGADLEITLLNQTATGLYPRVFFQCVHMDNTAVTPIPSISYGIGARQVAQDTDAVRFFFSGGNIAAGHWAIYGLA